MELQKINFDFSYDLKKADFKQDILQQEMLNFYLRADPRFRQAFYNDFTPQFVQFLKDKAKLKEPVSLSMSGETRSGKSVSAISIAFLINYLNGRIMDIRYIVGNAIDFMETLRNMKSEELLNSAFVIDEDKQGLFGTGSFAKKMKMEDLSNIIAVNNISALSLCPTKFARSESSLYGIRSFGRDFEQKVVRFMLYNLQESASTTKPMGMIYIPIFTKMLPLEIGEPLNKEYLAKKMEWVNKEMTTGQNLLGEMKKRLALILSKDPKFLDLKKKERIAYATMKLGSEYTKSETEEICILASLFQQGVINDEG